MKCSASFLKAAKSLPLVVACLFTATPLLAGVNPVGTTADASVFGTLTNGQVSFNNNVVVQSRVSFQADTKYDVLPHRTNAGVGGFKDTLSVSALAAVMSAAAGGGVSYGGLESVSVGSPSVSLTNYLANLNAALTAGNGSDGALLVGTTLNDAAYALRLALANQGSLTETQRNKLTAVAAAVASLLAAARSAS